jgi:hypothetical protein
MYRQIRERFDDLLPTGVRARWATGVNRTKAGGIMS